MFAMDLQMRLLPMLQVINIRSPKWKVRSSHRTGCAKMRCLSLSSNLLESTDPEGPIAKYLEKRGEGIQHIAFRVENLEEALAELKERGIKLIDEKPRQGAGGAKIAFLHPKATHGVLIELSER